MNWQYEPWIVPASPTARLLSPSIVYILGQMLEASVQRLEIVLAAG